MEFLYKNACDQGGIYKITNVQNNKFYIGSTNRFSKRARDHYCKLKRNRHRNWHLQASWNKWGEDAFVFEVLEVNAGDFKSRTKREQEILFDIQSDNNWHRCYNLSKKAIPKNPAVDIETFKDFKKAMSNIKKEFYKTEKGEKAAKNSGLSRKGKSYEEIYGVSRAKKIKEKIRQNKLIEMSKPEVKENLRKHLKGKTYEERFGEQKATLIKRDASERRKGKYTGKENPRYKVVEDVKLLSPDGKIYTKIEGIKDFAICHNLSPNHLSELLRGKRKTHKGWRVIPINFSDGC